MKVHDMKLQDNAKCEICTLAVEPELLCIGSNERTVAMKEQYENCNVCYHRLRGSAAL